MMSKATGWLMLVALLSVTGLTPDALSISGRMEYHNENRYRNLSKHD